MHGKYHAVVMAAQRVGEENPVAKAAGVSHKCIAPVGGKPLLQNVLDTLRQCDQLGMITVVVEDADILQQVPTYVELEAEGRARFRPSGQTIAASVFSAIEGIDKPAPVYITTGDNALLLPEMVHYFLDQAEEAGADAATAMCRKDVVKQKYPEGECNFLPFLDGSWSNCNQYAILTDRGMAGVQIFRHDAQFGKKPERSGKTMGKFVGWMFNKGLIPRSLLLLVGRIKLKAKLKAIDLPYPDAPIDVDDAHTMELSTRILEERRLEAAAQ